jgi:hypothetical protein
VTSNAWEAELGLSERAGTIVGVSVSIRPTPKPLPNTCSAVRLVTLADNLTLRVLLRRVGVRDDHAIAARALGEQQRTSPRTGFPGPVDIGILALVSAVDAPGL